MALVIASGLVIAAAVFVYHLALYWPARIDDTYITLCYARNLATGHGPIYSVGVPRAEGCTTFLWMLMLTIPHLVHVDAFLFAKFAGLLSVIGASLIVGTAAWRVTSKPSAWLAVAVFLLIPSNAVNALTGMETGFAALTVALASYLYLTKSPWLSAACLAVVLTRPEGILLAIILLAADSLRAENRKVALLRNVLAFAIPFALYWRWRSGFYGHSFPLPYYIKGTDGGWPGLAKTEAFALAYSPILLGSIVALWYKRQLWPIVLGCGLCIAYFASVHPMMWYCDRYQMPYLTGLIIAFGVMLSQARKPVAIAFGLTCTLLVTNTAESANVATAGTGNYKAHVALGKWLGSQPHGTLVCGDAGAIAYYSGWKAIDPFGLNNEQIAMQPISTARFVRESRPDVIVLRSGFADHMQEAAPPDQMLYNRCLKGFCLERTYEYRSGYYLLVYRHS